MVEPERIWIDRPRHDDRLARLGLRVLSAVSGRAVDPTERPPESIARRAIEQIRVDSHTGHHSETVSGSGHDGATIHGRLVIEGDGGRIADVGAQFDRKKLEWVRNFLRQQLAGDSA